jgi:hypothetical protein
MPPETPTVSGRFGATADRPAPFADIFANVSLDSLDLAGAPATEIAPAAPAKRSAFSAAVTAGIESLQRPVVTAPPAVAEPHDAVEDDIDEEELDFDDHLTLRDIARERLRARLLAAHAAKQQRSAYELVFLMLATAVTILVIAPPLVDILLALHGTRP